MNIRRKENKYAYQREKMVREQLVNRGIVNPHVLEAMRKVERHRFVLPEYVEEAYEDQPLPIGYSQTISQPYIVAYMISVARVKPGERVLEIGAGSGYQAAVLGEIAAEVFAVEVIPELGRRAEEVLRELNYDNVHIRIGDGYNGWEEHAPYDAVIVAAAAPEIPEPLLDQLADGGRFVIPVEDDWGMQHLMLLTKKDGRIDQRQLVPVRFVPFTRENEGS